MAKYQKDVVYLRKRTRKNGTEALYLDICRDGKRKNEYLKLYLVPELTREDKRKNQATMQLAEMLRAKRVVELQTQPSDDEEDRKDVLFFDLMQSYVDRKQGTTKTSWRNCMAHLLRYEKNHNILLRDITPAWVRGFRDYLDKEAKTWDIDSRKRMDNPKPIAEGTKSVVFSKLCGVFSQAIIEGLIDRNPTLGIERFREPEGNREFLTIDEVRRLRQVPPPTPELGRAFFFSCLTGVRWSDIVKLRWSEVQELNGGTRIVFKQKKTGGLEYLDLNDQAAELLGERAENEELVFPGLEKNTARIGIAAWVRSAGINKHITFHCARHTFAVMMLDLGVDIYTVSKLLGHKSVETTQIYAKVLDKNKKAAVDKIPRIF